MKLALCLFHYFPYGGLQRDFLRIAKECHHRGHDIYVFTTKWKGVKPDFIKTYLIKPKGFSNHKRMQDFANQVTNKFKIADFDLAVGFNKIPGLDVYYAADDCFVAQPKYKNNFLRRLGSSYRTYEKLENSVFGPNSKTRILLLSSTEQENYLAHYQIDKPRFCLLPPGISKAFIPEENSLETRENYRKKLNLTSNDYMMISIGSGFHTKGIDRAINVFTHLSEKLKKNCRYFIVGNSKDIDKYQKLTKSANLENHIHFLGLRDDVQQLLQAADLTIHLARNESAGHVILESLVSGCPILVTENCGYAPYIKQANAGKVITPDLSPKEASQQLQTMLNKGNLSQYRKNALDFSEKTDLFSLVSKAVDFIENKN